MTVAFLVVVLLLPLPAAAQTGMGTVTLDASAAKVVIGHGVVLSGAIDPAAAGEEVEIRDDADALVTTATTDGSGGFSARVVPERTTGYRAVWGSATSDAVTVKVRAIVSVRMSAVRLFDTVTVRGAVEPARPGRAVDVALVRGGRVLDSRRVEMGSAGGFTAEFRVMEPGTYRARAAFSGSDYLGDRTTTAADETPLPRLSAGSRGVFVELLESRLLELNYRLAGPNDGRYDLRTADAIVAFHKVNRMERAFVADAATWRALADPITPRARFDWRGLHIEVDQTRQVLYTVEDGEVTNVLHVSTGAGGATRDGRFRVYRKLAGFSPNHLYYPSYFDGLRALHGWTEVPTYPASHGCVRIPYWNAQWVFGIAGYGTRVAVYHS